jgi:hypothetical protein
VRYSAAMTKTARDPQPPGGGSLLEPTGDDVAAAAPDPAEAPEPGTSRKQLAIVVGALLAIALLTYGAYITALGFYWDDWPTAWINHSGTYSITSFFGSDRPISGWMYAAMFRFLPVNPLTWQVLSLLTRWAGAVAVWWVVRSIWPARERIAFMVAALYLVYPGFTHQSIALTYSGATYLLLMLWISFGCSIAALRRPGRQITLTAVAIVAVALTFTIEYFLMLEVVRVAIFYVVVSQSTTDRRERRIRALRAWVPYVVATFAYFVWRFLIFHPSRPGVGVLALEELKISPVDAVVVTAKRIVTTVADTGALAWAQPFNAKAIDFSRGGAVALSVVLGLAAAYLAFKACSSLPSPRDLARPDDGSRPAGEEAGERVVTKQILAIAALALVTAGIPAWMTARQVELGNTWDRYTLGGMFGAALLVVGTMRALRLSARATLCVFVVLVGASTAFHVQTSSTYADDWVAQSELISQLHWRAPTLARDTPILLDPGPLIDARGYSLTAAIADSYGLHLGPNGEMPLWVFLPGDFEAATSSPSGLPVGGLAERNFTTSLDPEKFVVMVKPERGCLRVLDPKRPETWPSSRMGDAEGRRSRPDRAIVAPAERTDRLETIPEAEHGWCHSYETVERALADGDVAGARRIADAARQQGLAPALGEEWLPFAEAYLRDGDAATAASILTTAAAMPGTGQALCTFADRIADDQSLPASAREVAERSCRR